MTGAHGGRAGREHPGRPAPESERGMVTVELALAAIGAAVGCVLLAWVLALVGLLVRCQDTAAEVARQEARADRSAVAEAMADRPDGARVTVQQNRDRISVRVDLDARPWASWLPVVPLAASATVLREPS